MNKIPDVLFDIYNACKDIPNWLDNLRPFHTAEDIKYFEKMINLENRLNKPGQNGQKPPKFNPG